MSLHKRVAVAVVMAVTALGAVGAGAVSTEDGGAGAGDAGSFGLTTDDASENATDRADAVWCTADAGSLGLADPVVNCR